MLRLLEVPEDELEAAGVDMKLVIPPHLMMKTCKPCEDNCRGCFAGIDGAKFCYECLHGYLFDREEEQCVVNPSWSTTESEIKVRSNK